MKLISTFQLLACVTVAADIQADLIQTDSGVKNWTTAIANFHNRFADYYAPARQLQVALDTTMNDLRALNPALTAAQCSSLASYSSNTLEPDVLRSSNQLRSSSKTLTDGGYGPLTGHYIQQLRASVGNVSTGLCADCPSSTSPAFSSTFAKIDNDFAAALAAYN